jgi:hypothetical protein
LNILNAGEDLFIQIQRNLFVSDSGIAETLCRHSQQFIGTLLLILRENVWPPCINNNTMRVATEFQKQIDHFHERFHRFDQANELRYACPNEVLDETHLSGRPRLLIPKEQLEGLRSLGFSWSTIGKMLCVSERTIRRRRADYEMPLGNSGNFSIMSHDQLDEEVRSILQVSPNSGERMVVGGIRARGLIVQRRRVRASILRVDPVSRELRRHTIAYRRVYNVPTPNALW